VVLDAEITTASGKTERGRRNSRLDSEHEPSEPVVGSTPHARGTEQVGNRSSTVDRGQISLPTAEAAFPDLADVLDQSLGTDGLDRLLRGADGDLPGSVCVRGLVACSASCAALSGDRTPQPGVGDAADAERFPWDHGCRYLLRDRDAIYDGDWAAITKGMGMEEVITAPRSPWQNPYVERLIGSIRRECLDHVIVWNRRSLCRILQSYFVYYQHSRTHLALVKDAPESRVVEKPECGRIVVIPQVGGLHHRYQRRAA
jgi:hypothetical protein